MYIMIYGTPHATGLGSGQGCLVANFLVRYFRYTTAIATVCTPCIVNLLNQFV